MGDMEDGNEPGRPPRRGPHDETRSQPSGRRTRPIPRDDGTAPPETGRDPQSKGARHAAATAAHGIVAGGRAVGRATAAASRGTVHVARRASEAQGAGETGLSRLIQVHAFSSAGDTALMVGLAGTLFFQVPQGEAKSQVLMFLLLTMLPFAIVAPLIGPLLDRFRHGRRWSIGATMAIRAFLCWVLASSITEESTWQFPAALGVLVSSKAYLITRSSATPRLLPEQLTLVKANGRLSLAGTVGAGLGGGLAGLASQIGPEWALRVGFALFIIGTILAVRLPSQADSSQGEEQAAMRDLAAESEGGSRRGISGSLVTALRANSGLRWLSGFLTIYLAFLLRAEPFPGWETRGSLLLALVIGAAGVGNAIGTMTGALVRTSSPRVIVLACLFADAVVAVVAAVQFNLYTAIAVGLVAGIGQQMGKLALDALIQDTVVERIRTSVFARSETLLQLSWVIGGLVAVLLPMNATIGMTTAAILLVLWTVAVVIWNSGRSLPTPRARRSRPPGPPRQAYEDERGREHAPGGGHTSEPDDHEMTMPIRRDQDPWEPPPRAGAADADDRRDRWRSRFGPDS